MLSPAKLFMENWDSGRRWSGPEVQNFVPPCVEFNKSVSECLRLPDAIESYEALKNLQRGDDNDVKNGRILHILREIDSFFELAHPRSLNRAKLFDRLPLSHWLRKLVYSRLENGFFASTEIYNLVPRGPLIRSAREAFASSAYSFPDQFTFLTVVTKEISIEDRPIQITPMVLDRSVNQGAGLAPTSSGCEKVAFIPIAQLEDHLLVTQTEIKKCAYVDFRLKEGLDAATIIDTVLDDVVFADIVVSGELVVNAEAANRLGPLIGAKPGRTRLLLAGSGNTLETRDDLPWNEARVFNGAGVELWRQRKIWQAGLDSHRAKELGLTPGHDGRVMEQNHAGSEVVVADVDGLGRCVVLICQDIKSAPLASELVRRYQPDWVFVPIMDWGTGITRWAHQEAFGLSILSPARFLIASSLSMVEKLKKTEQPCGLAIGPRLAADEDESRVCQPVYVKSAPHGYGMVEWRGDWGKTSLAYEPPVESQRKDDTTH
ncbi:Uncharacterized protein ALO52_02227 [Pseudomonas syringae pv. primulae]|uniref:Uncharacterized protein n=1 Tax=Pseudomonas syringae pv. primulae TaxID=251707 RepID=A0A0N8SK85_9PSED|nr:hypothetical protein [Pseudomonas syringae group genomosp. 3]KPY34488.1 Uncharacterized protein ALO52_02227 [Pseudomonas syringae pv. primulae]